MNQQVKGTQVGTARRMAFESIKICSLHTAERRIGRGKPTPSRFLLDIHHRPVPVPLEGFLADRFHFQPKRFGGSFTGRTVPTALTGREARSL
ncbi:hypothetical protein AVEN_39117-1 [Araneus ventricosus]|uniref:Uncharacterized protein n=1 Tax=Araneus ventricosus TaxID=182803 RepID=A0A4Y2DI00_ARAVE|nr:hypothetical protein AVEN_39117-1 [Araneus ventricosus]